MTGTDAGSDLFPESRLHRIVVISHFDRIKGNRIFHQLVVFPAPNRESGEKDQQNEAYKTCNTKDDSRQHFVLQETCVGWTGNGTARW